MPWIPPYDGDGKVFLASTEANVESFYAVLQQTDLKLVGAGGNTLVRFTRAGGLDFSFEGGVAPGPITHYAAAQLIDGKLVGAGSALQPGGSIDRFALARYEGDGSVDAGFGDAGHVITQLGAVESRIFALRLQADTRLVAAGRSDSDFALARYFTQDCGNGVLDEGEQCDDGNAVSGDCCSPACEAEPDGPANCDANSCTRPDGCAGGVCVPGACQLGAACTICGGSCENEAGVCGCSY